MPARRTRKSAPESRRLHSHLGGVCLGISQSDPPRKDLNDHEIQTADLNRFTVRLARVVLDRGGKIVSGHDWRPQGTMRALENFAREQLAASGDPPPGPRLMNYVPWPDRPGLDQRDLAALGTVLQVTPVPLPKWAAAALAQYGSHEPRYHDLARIFALFQLRLAVAEDATARVCLGGKIDGYSGRYSGVVEEVALALARQQPVYLLGRAGGATSDIIHVLRGQKHRLKDSEGEEDVRFRHEFEGLRADLKKAAAPRMPSWVPKPVLPWEWSTPGLVSFIKSKKSMFSRRYNGLDAEENAELWDTPSLDVGIDLVVRGLTRLTASTSRRVPARARKNGRATAKKATRARRNAKRGKG